jgi:hypothetical protein
VNAILLVVETANVDVASTGILAEEATVVVGEKGLVDVALVISLEGQSDLFAGEHFPDAAESISVF